jgi:uncharacterized protein YndB with AHSA1/START domain
MTLNGTKQVAPSVEIHASTDFVWEVLSDSRLLPRWVPAVDEVTSCSLDGEGVGATRSCTANLAGRSGTMVERCVEYTPTTRLAYLVDDESFGMRKMFDDYGFSLNLERLGSERTRATIETHYTPRNAACAAMNAILLRRQFRNVANDILDGLRTFTEARQVATAE